MITCTWLPGLGEDVRADVGQLLAECAEADDEAGFSRPDLSAPQGARHLLVWLERRASDRHGQAAAPRPALAAYLRLTAASDGSATAQYVVRPQLRSRGITTMLLERTAASAGTSGWQLGSARPVTVLAAGDHPAADRIWRRFAARDLRRGRQFWQLICPLRTEPGHRSASSDGDLVRPAGAADAAAVDRLRAELADPERSRMPAAEVLVLPHGAAIAGAAWLDTRPEYRTDFGPAGRIAVKGARGHAGPHPVTDLLAAALDRMRAAGLRTAVIGIDAADEPVARVCRGLGFAHDRTDTEYVLT